MFARYENLPVSSVMQSMHMVVTTPSGDVYYRPSVRSVGSLAMYNERPRCVQFSIDRIAI
jgi:hypothetical protein